MTRSAFVATAALALVCCDALIANRVRVAGSAGVAGESIVEATRETLTDCGLHPITTPPAEEVWVWRDPQKPPGLHATLTPSSQGLLIRLEQGLYGPIGATEKYTEVKTALLKMLQQRYGTARVTIE